MRRFPEPVHLGTDAVVTFGVVAIVAGVVGVVVTRILVTGVVEVGLTVEVVGFAVEALAVVPLPPAAH